MQVSLLHSLLCLVQICPVLAVDEIRVFSHLGWLEITWFHGPIGWEALQFSYFDNLLVIVVRVWLVCCRILGVITHANITLRVVRIRLELWVFHLLLRPSQNLWLRIFQLIHSWASPSTPLWLLLHNILQRRVIRLFFLDMLDHWWNASRIWFFLKFSTRGLFLDSHVNSASIYLNVVQPWNFMILLGVDAEEGVNFGELVPWCAAFQAFLSSI